MSYAGLSLGNTPPIRVPLRFFLTAPLFLLLAGLLLTAVDPALLRGRWNPEWLAVTHLWVLGFMLMVMLGAMQQVIPILLGSSLPRATLVSALGHLLLSLGVLVLVWGFLRDCTGCFPVAAALLMSAVSVVGGAALAALFRAPSRHATGSSLRLALAALAVTVLLGAWLALGHGGELPLARRFTDLHLGWGLAGWTVLLVTGVAWQVVPMFQITPRYPPLVMRGFAPFHFGALVAWAVGRWWLQAPWLELAGEALLSASLALFAGATLRLQARRRRRIPDSTLDFWRLSMASLLAVILLWWLRRGGVAVPGLLPGVLFCAGFVGAAILGMLYKILPFLVWLHLTSRAQALGLVPRGLPNMKQVIPGARSRLLFRLYLAWLPLALGVAFRPEWFARPAGGLLAVIALLLGWHMVQAVRLYRVHLAGLEEGERG